MTEPNAARERAGEIGSQMADSLTQKIKEAINGLPASSPEQKAAIAGLVAEDLEDFQDELMEQPA